MKILTLDLSTHSSGFCAGQDEKIQQHGYITASQKDVVKRIIKMRNQIGKIIQKHNPIKIVMEQVRPQVNSHTNKVLMWLQAAIVIAAYEINPKIECKFINASEWRAAIKIKQGRGIKRDEVKSRDIQYVQSKYNIKVNDDQADAICIFDAYWIKQNNEINWG